MQLYKNVSNISHSQAATSAGLRSLKFLHEALGGDSAKRAKVPWYVHGHAACRVNKYMQNKFGVNVVPLMNQISHTALSVEGTTCSVEDALLWSALCGRFELRLMFSALRCL